MKLTRNFNGKRFAGLVVWAILGIAAPWQGRAAEVIYQLDPLPATGTVVVQLFNSADTFVDLRDPVKVVSIPAGGPMSGRIADLPAGEYALMAYQDVNGNGRLDKNFIGIPREPLGFSNRHWPQGPPSFARAAFRLESGDAPSFDIGLKPVFGRRGLLGVGAGVITQTSPYRGSQAVIVLPIPAISYIGDRVQIMGPAAQVGIVNRGAVSLAATVRYRLGAYRERDSSYLRGLGDRDDTALGGLALQAKLPAGVRVSAGYEHDLLNRVNGGGGHLRVGKAFQQKLLTLSPYLALNGLTAGLADYDYGVPADRAREGRPAYRPGAVMTEEAGMSLFVELPGSWRLILNGSVTHLPSELTDSPIVDRAQVFGCFGAVNRLF